MKIVIPEFVLEALKDETCSLLMQACDFVVVGRDGQIDGDITGAEVVMLTLQMSSATCEALVRLPSVRWVHTVTAGVDYALDLFRQDHPVVLTNARGVFDVPIAETVLTYILMIAKRMPEFLAQQRERRWQSLSLREVSGLTVGLVGLGGIGQEIARRCQALGMRVVATRRRIERGAPFVDVLYLDSELATLLGASDFVVLATPLTAETRGLINAERLRQMRRDAWLINIARGGVVDEAALLAALQCGEIAGAALDVFGVEPLPPDSPFWALPNVILTPHNSWNTPHLLPREAALFLDNLRRYLACEPLRNVVDKVRGY